MRLAVIVKQQRDHMYLRRAAGKDLVLIVANAWVKLRPDVDDQGIRWGRDKDQCLGVEGSRESTSTGHVFANEGVKRIEEFADSNGHFDFTRAIAAAKAGIGRGRATRVHPSAGMAGICVFRGHDATIPAMVQAALGRGNGGLG
jgi:hypothetical protein